MLLDNPHEFRTPDFIKKYGPVLTKDDIPYPAELIFNAGVAKYNGKYVMLFRNDYDFPIRILAESTGEGSICIQVFRGE